MRFWSDTILGIQQPLLAGLDDVDALRSWAEAIVDAQRANDFRGGCPLGSLASDPGSHETAAVRTLVTSGPHLWCDRRLVRSGRRRAPPLVATSPGAPATAAGAPRGVERRRTAVTSGRWC